MKRYTIDVAGMTCDHCTVAVAAALRQVPGVMDVGVDLSCGRATVECGESTRGVGGLLAAVRDAGYSVLGFREQAVSPADS